MNQLQFLFKLKELADKRTTLLEKDKILKEQIDALDDSPKSEKHKERLWSNSRNLTYLIMGINKTIKDLEKEYLEHCYSLIK